MKEHSMTPDDLRALADAIVYRDSLAIARAADYLRACADAEPVARIYTDGWQLVPVKPTREMLESTSWPGCAATDYEHMLAAAPKAEPETFESELRSFADTPEQVAFVEKLLAPQAAPCVGNDPTCPCQDGDACHYKDTDGTKAWPVYNPFLRECTEPEEQAEPKRPQTCLWSRADNEMVYCCYCGRELKGEIGDSDAE